MFLLNIIKYLLPFLILFELIDCLIISSVNAGRKKFKTISFDYLLPPLVFEKDNKLGFSFRGHYKFRRPTFKWDLNLPLELPVNVEHDKSSSLQSTAINNEDVNYQPTILNHNINTGGEQLTLENLNYHDLHHLIEQIPSNQQIKIGHNSIPHFLAANANYANDQRQHEIFEKSFVKPEILSVHHTNAAPYRGKAQVSSFIENGHLVTAHHAMDHLHEKPKKIEVIDEAFEDQLDGPFGKNAETRTQNIKRMSTVRLGYRDTKPKDYFVTAHEYHPDSVPMSISNSLPAMSKYYTSLSFTNHLPDTPAYTQTYQLRKDNWQLFGNLKRKFKDFKALLPVVTF